MVQVGQRLQLKNVAIIASHDKGNSTGNNLVIKVHQHSDVRILSSAIEREACKFKLACLDELDAMEKIDRINTYVGKTVN